MPRPAFQARAVGKVSVYPGIDFDLKFEIKLIQQLFLGREVGEERTRGNARGLGDQCRRRAEPGFGDLVHRCCKDGSAFLRTSHSRHASESTAARSWLAPAVPCDKAGIGNSNGSNAGSASTMLAGETRIAPGKVAKGPIVKNSARF